MKENLRVLLIFHLSLVVGVNEIIRAQTPELVIPVGHQKVRPDGTITSLHYSSDDKLILSAGYDLTIKIWEAKTGLLIKTINFGKPVLEAQFVFDNTSIIASTTSGVYLIDTQSGKVLRRFNSGISHSARVTNDSSILLIRSFNHGLSIWKFSNGQFISRLANTVEGTSYSQPIIDLNPITTLALGPLSDSSIGVWDLKSKKLIHNLRHESAVASCKLSSDKTKVITTDESNQLHIWSVKSGQLIKSIKSGNRVSVFSQSSNQFASFSDREIKIIETQTGKVLTIISDTTETFTTANFSNDNLHIVTASPDNSIKIWERKHGNLISTISGAKALRLVKVSKDESTLAIPSGKGIRFMDLQTGQLQKKNILLGSEVLWIDFSQNNKSMLFRTAQHRKVKFQLWHLDSGLVHDNLIGYSAIFNKSGNSIYYVDVDNVIKKWDVNRDSQNDRLSHTIDLKKVSSYWHGSSLFSIDSNGNLIIPSGVNKLTLYDSTGKMKRIFEYPAEYINSKSDARGYPLGVISPDNQYVALHDLSDDSLRIWNMITGKPYKTIPTYDADIRSNWWSGYYTGDGSDYFYFPNDTLFLLGNYASITSPFFSNDGRSFVFSTLENISKIHDLVNDKTETIKGAIQGVLWKTGSAIVIENHHLKIIDLKSKETKLTWIPIGESDYVITHPSGLFDASPGAMDKLYFVQGLDIIDFNQLKERYYEPGLWKKVMAGEELRSAVGMKSIELPPDIQVGQVDAEGYLNINLTNRGGGIGEVNLFVNGKEAIKDARDASIKPDAANASIKVFVGKHKSIVKGQENLIAVKAWNKDHWVQSRGQVVSYHSKEIESYKPAVYILTCGVSDYTGTEIDLKYAAKDANDVSVALQLGAKKLFGAERSYVYNLTTTQAKEFYPTKTNILKVFEKISSTAHPLDIFVMYVSGHGINYGGQDGDWHYLTQEAYTGSGAAYNDPAIRAQTTISSNELVELFKKVPALKQVLMLDACASGKVVDNLMAQKDIESSTLRALDRMRDRTGMHIITGCTADAVSYEASKYGQGVLTYSLLEGIRGAALREDQYVDVNKLFQYAQDRVPQLAEGIGGIQSPQVFSPQGSQSFDIGLLSDVEKKEIPIAKIRPVFVRSNFQDANELEDILNLSKLVDESLNEVSSKGIDSKIIFVDVREYPDGCKLTGSYKKENGKLFLLLKKRCGSDVMSFDIKSDNVEGLKTEILKVL